MNLILTQRKSNCRRLACWDVSDLAGSKSTIWSSNRWHENGKHWPRWM